MPGATDNVAVVSGSFSENIASDSIGSVHFQRTKQVWGVDGVAVDVSAANPLPVAIITDAAGSTVDTDDGSIAAAQASLALAVALNHGFDGTVWRRLKAFSGGQAVSEQAAQGTPTISQATVNATTANGVQLIAANGSGTRRRVVITNHSTSVIYLGVGATGLTAGSAAAGEALAGVVGAEKSFFTSAELRATVA